MLIISLAAIDAIEATENAPSVAAIEAFELQLEHSLVSLSKWEALYEKPFFSLTPKTAEETGDYIKFMVLNDDVPENFIDRMVKEDFEKITEYINSKQTATFFQQQQEPSGAKEQVTSDLIYYWLVNFRIPFEPTETWHLNRLMTLVRICGIKQSKPKKMTQQQIMERNRALNEQRRREMGTSG